uniref:GAE domain-containing protein n=1 Tax=Heterorhabditis bacteriophora TaxID=37862 RepID=A0A1I7X8Y5_HETBA
MSSNPEFIQIDDEIINIPANQSIPITLYFRNIMSKPISVEVLIFIHNVESGQQEETLSLQISYVK